MKNRETAVDPDFLGQKCKHIKVVKVKAMGTRWILMKIGCIERRQLEGERKGLGLFPLFRKGKSEHVWSLRGETKHTVQRIHGGQVEIIEAGRNGIQCGWRLRELAVLWQKKEDRGHGRCGAGGKRTFLSDDHLLNGGNRW